MTSPLRATYWSIIILGEQRGGLISFGVTGSLLTRQTRAVTMALLNSVSTHLSEFGRSNPSIFQLMVGVGMPVAMHLRETVQPFPIVCAINR